MSEIEPGYYWARWKGWTDPKLQPWEIVEVWDHGNRLGVSQFDEPKGRDRLEVWEFGPRLEPPKESVDKPRTGG